MAETIHERAYAKLNLTLDVLGKLPNGFHDLSMVMESVELGDDVDVTPRSDGEIRLNSNLPWLPRDGRNLAVEAVKVFRTALGDESIGADIYLRKRIPVGAGMAGGSTNAAAVLRALNRWRGRPFDADKLRELGLQIGSDVPYCICGGSRLAQGQGEILSPLPMPPECHVVICKPSFSISTGELFKKIDARSSRIRPDTKGLIEAMEKKDVAGMSRRLYNVFEDVLPRNLREVGEMKSRFLDHGALGTVMTGTGSAVFGIFDDYDRAADASVELGEYCRDVFLTKFADEIVI